MSLIKFRGAVYREVVAVQMGKLVDTAEFNAALKQFEKESKYFATQWQPAQKLYQELKQFISGIAPKAEAVLTKAQGHAFDDRMIQLLEFWQNQYETYATQLKKIHSAVSSGVVSYDNLVQQVDSSEQKNQQRLANLKLFQTSTAKVLGLLTKYTDLIYNFEDTDNETKSQWYFDFIKQFPGHDVLAPVNSLAEAYARLQTSMESLQSLFATAHQNLLGKAKKHKPSKVDKKKSTDKQTEFQTKSEPSPSETDIAASQEEVANPTKHAKAQEVIKAAVDEFLEPAKTEYDTLYNFISRVSPGTIKKLKPALDRSEHLVFGEPTVELALADEFTAAQEKTFQTISKATRYLAGLFGKILGKYLERDEKSKPRYPGLVAQLKKLSPGGEYMDNLQSLAKQYDEAEKALA
jgi:hypothetical protein